MKMLPSARYEKLIARGSEAAQKKGKATVGSMLTTVALECGAGPSGQLWPVVRAQHLQSCCVQDEQRFVWEPFVAITPRRARHEEARATTIRG